MRYGYVNCWNFLEKQEECYILDQAPKNDNNWFCSNEITDDINWYTMLGSGTSVGTCPSPNFINELDKIGDTLQF